MAEYGCLVTAIGRAKIANAILTGIPLVMTEMAVGDGAGNSVTPTSNQATLVREVYRRSINAMTIAAGTDDTLLLEMVIPASEGPFVIRESCVIDEDGDMVAVANLPASVKPAPGEGVTKDVVITLSLKVDSAAAVTVQVNPSLVIATRTWVDGNYMRLPGDGTTGQLARKKSNLRNDWEFFDPAFDASNFTFDCIEEPQELAEDQTIVTFVDITTAGIAVYVENEAGGLERLIRDQDYTILDETSITLSSSYPATTRVLGVQNDPNGAVTPHGIGALARAENLNDLSSKPTARQNLGVAYASQAEAEGGAAYAVVMTPLAVRQFVDKRIATLLQAQEGTSEQTLMTPKGSRDLIAAMVATLAQAMDSGNNTNLITPAVIQQLLLTAAPTASRLEIFDTEAPAGWLPLAGGTLGKVAGTYSGDAVKKLYFHIWNRLSRNVWPVLNGALVVAQGASAQADWDAGRLIRLLNDRKDFYRSWDPLSATQVGEWKIDTIKEHWHGSSDAWLDSTEGNGEGPHVTFGDGPAWGGVKLSMKYGTTETAPRHRTILSCIKL